MSSAIAGSRNKIVTLCSLLFALSTVSLTAAPKKTSPAISVGQDGKLSYATDAHGNRIPDFSHCGYAGGDRPIPTAPVKVVVPPAPGDSTVRIQRALDYVANLPADSNGLRGAVLLLKGRHEVSGGLRISASGVVLRGQGTQEGGTILVATGIDRRTLIRIYGTNDYSVVPQSTATIKEDYVAVGATSFTLDNIGGLKRGDAINIMRPCTQAWIDKLGMTEFGGGIGDWRLTWKPGSRDLRWDRIITSVDGNRITLDAPITTAIEKEYGGGTVEHYHWPGRIENVGIENLRCESTFDSANQRDENHSWMAITVENAANIWVRQVTATHFAGSMVAIYETCKSVTVQDCLSLAPISEDGGYRRHTFFTMGQLSLFLRCHAENGRHDFSVGHCATGPNAFVQCDASFPLRDSGPIESWASGVLYDCVTIDGNGLSLANRGGSPHGAGWSAANSVLWQCRASVIRCENPPTAQNWAFGSWGEFEGNGLWNNSNSSIRPASLYVAQLTDRLGRDAANRVSIMRRSGEEYTNPTLDQAAELISASRNPAPQLADYIANASSRDPIPTEPGNAETVADIPPPKSNPSVHSSVLRITNGWLVCDGKLVIGGRTNVAWWRGNIHPSDAITAEAALTRFVPGRIGPGYADDLSQLAETMASTGITALNQNYGLWYDRRRDDHERVRRINGDAWPPFYELPFARSGQGQGWDGMSRYDLTKYNPWYWDRLAQFASLCDQHGLVLLHQNYFQHNILEAGAHWADCPWRSANNINETGFPEPPPYAGDKRIFMAEQFYDVSHPVRRKLHRAYIRQCLDNFKTNSNVIQFTSAEYTGPLHFVQFWLDTIAEWEKETGLSPIIGLSCTKDVQDAILNDSERAKLINVIEFKYWWLTGKGTFSPKGGQNLAPRQFERAWKGGKPSDANLASMAADYRQRYPAKPVICDFSQGAWEFLCAGGSMPNLPITPDEKLLRAIPAMKPWTSFALREPGRQYLVYLHPGTKFDLSEETGSFVARPINLKTGKLEASSKTINAGKDVQLSNSGLFWLTRN